MTTPSSINNDQMFPIKNVNLDYSVSAADMWKKVSDSISDTPNQWYLLYIPFWTIDEVDVLVSRNIDAINPRLLHLVRYDNALWFVQYVEPELDHLVSVVDRWNKLVEYDQEMTKAVEDRVRKQVAEDIRAKNRAANWSRTFGNGMEHAARIALKIEGCNYE